MRCGEEKVDNDIDELIKLIQNVNEGFIKLEFFCTEKQGFLQYFSKIQTQKIFESWLLPFKINQNENLIEEEQQQLENQEIKKEQIYNDDQDLNFQQNCKTVQNIIFEILSYANMDIEHIDESHQNKESKTIKFPYKISFEKEQDEKKMPKEKQEN